MGNESRAIVEKIGKLPGGVNHVSGPFLQALLKVHPEASVSQTRVRASKWASVLSLGLLQDGNVRLSGKVLTMQRGQVLRDSHVHSGLIGQVHSRHDISEPLVGPQGVQSKIGTNEIVKVGSFLLIGTFQQLYRFVFVPQGQLHHCLHIR